MPTYYHSWSKARLQERLPAPNPPSEQVHCMSAKEITDLQTPLTAGPMHTSRKDYQSPSLSQSQSRIQRPYRETDGLSLLSSFSAVDDGDSCEEALPRIAPSIQIICQPEIDLPTKTHHWDFVSILTAVIFAHWCNFWTKALGPPQGVLLPIKQANVMNS